MKITVDEKKCIGCAACVNMCPDIFEIKDGKAKVKGNPEDKKCARNSSEICPVNAIKVED